jgi:spore coat protein U-like protein
MMKRILIATAMVAAATPAFAAETTTVNGATVAFSGTRATVCEIRDYENNVQFGALGEFGAATPVTDTASIYCNVKFNASIASQNGFLRLTTLDSGATPTSQSDTTAQNYTQFASALDYGVSVQGLGSANTTAIGANSPVSLGTNLSPISASAQLTYTTATSPKPLLGGNYNDTVTLTLTPQAF